MEGLYQILIRIYSNKQEFYSMTKAPPIPFGGACFMPVQSA